MTRRDFIGNSLSSLGFATLSGGESLAFAVRPLTSLGTSDKAIATGFKV